MFRVITLSFLALFLSCFTSNAQDTLFFDKQMRKLPDTNGAAFFRPAPQAENGLYKVTDYYITGVVRDISYYSIEKGSSKELINDGLSNKRLQGTSVRFHANGKKSAEINYLDGKMNGNYVYIDSNGVKTSEGSYVNNMRNGLCKDYYPDGSLHAARDFKNGELDGIVRTYYKDGKQKRDAFYAKGKLKKGDMYDINGKKIAYTEFEVMPKPPYDVNMYLSKNIRYPPAARDSSIEGRVAVGFIVDKEGNITDPKIMRGVAHPILEREALRVVTKMPPWKPGIYDDEYWAVPYTLPITFRLK